jgi:integrase
MAKRKFGSIRKLPSGRYQARYPGPDGLLRPADTTFPTIADADAFLATQQADIIRKVWRAPRKDATTVADWVEQWVAQRAVKETTRANYESLAKLHIAGTRLGDMRIQDVTPADVRRWHVDLLAGLRAAADAKAAKAAAAERELSVATKRTGRTTAAHAYRLLRASMATAVEDELIDRNPCRLKGASTIEASERPIASIAEVMAMADSILPRYRCVIYLGAFAGLRYGEIAALRRRDVVLDLEKRRGSVTVEERVYRVRGELDFDAPKSRAGRRTVALPAVILPALANHLREHVGPGDDALVFTTRTGRVMSSFYGRWDIARNAVGREDMRFHDLRHTGQTLAAESGATIAQLMQMLGHSTNAAALVYHHATLEHAHAVADAISAKVEGDNVTKLRPRARRTG